MVALIFCAVQAPAGLPRSVCRTVVAQQRTTHCDDGLQMSATPHVKRRGLLGFEVQQQSACKLKSLFVSSSVLSCFPLFSHSL